jgi:hypothetical protein
MSSNSKEISSLSFRLVDVRFLESVPCQYGGYKCFYLVIQQDVIKLKGDK